MTNDLDLRVRLEREQRQALDQLSAARNRFNNIVSRLPPGARDVQIRRAGDELGSLQRQSIDATKRLMDYLMHGKLPDGYVCITVPGVTGCHQAAR
jgi:hypothetical protein